MAARQPAGRNSGAGGDHARSSRSSRRDHQRPRTIETAVAAIRKGAYDFIEKPFKADKLCHTVRRALKSARLKRQVEELKLKAGDDTDLCGNSTAIVQLRQLVDKIAPTGSRVLITGPSGSGKEVTARLIHAHSRRSENALWP